MTPGREFLEGGGAMGALMRGRDWSGSPLGAPEAWPEPLKLAVSICLNSRFPMVLWWGPELLMLYNDPYLPILGAGKHPRGLGRPAIESWREIWPVIAPQLARALGGEPTWSEDQLLCIERDGFGSESYFIYSYSPIRGTDGGIGGVFCAVTETTDRVLSERRLRILRELALSSQNARTVEMACARFAEVLCAANPDVPFALIYLEEGGEIRLLDPCGFPEGAPGQDAARAQTWRVREVLEGGKALHLSRLDRTLPPLPGGAWAEPATEALVLPVMRAGEGSDPVGVLVAGINPRRRLDEPYRGFLELVAGQMATAMASARAHEEERQRAEALAALDRAKTDFFSNVSHEFRTPLTLMLNPVEELLARPPAQPEARQLLEITHRNALRLLRLVNSLLDFSRIEAGRTQARYEPVDLGALTADLASLFRSATDRAGLFLEIDTETLPGETYVDRGMWEKIVLNLLSNAFKFTFEGGITVRVRPAPGGTEAELMVRDTGTGIPPHELPHLFERFHRVEGARGRSFEGSGIGLALVQELARLHGGAVSAESDSRGSTFTVSVPLGASHLPSERIAEGLGETPAGVAQAFVQEALSWLPDTPDRHPGPRDAEIEPPRAAADTGRVLLADDNADMRHYVGRLLTRSGFQVSAVADGATALQQARETLPDLVLADVMMPGLDGFALLRALREDPATGEIPIILLSARAGEEARVEGLEAGADDYLIKPFGARELVARVEANLRLARLRRETSALQTRLAAIVNASPDLIGFADAELRILYVNEAGRAMLGLPAIETIRRTRFTDYLDARDLAALQEDVFPSVCNQGAWHGEFTLHHRITGAPITAECDLFRIIDPATGTATHFASVVRDITERHRSEQRLIGQQRILEDIASGAPLGGILDAITGFVEAQEEGARASLLVVAQNGRHFRSGHGVSLPAAFHEAITKLSIEPPYIGICAEAVHCCHPVSIPDVAADRRYDPAWRELVLSLGLRAVRSTPILAAGGAAMATLTVYYGTARDPTPADPGLIDIATHLASIALYRDRNEASLRQNEERLRLIFDSAREYAIVTADGQGRITSWNRGAERILGFTEAEILGQPIGRLFTPEDVAAGVPDIELSRAITTGTAGNERWHLRRDGSRFFASGFTLRLDGGAEPGVLLMFRDRTNEQALEEAAERSRADLEAVLDAVPVGVWFTRDPDAAIATGNRQGSEWLGLRGTANASLSAPQRFRTTRDGTEIPTELLPLQRAARGEEVRDEILELHTEAGSRELLTSAVPLRDRNGRVIGAVSTGTDITLQRATERQLRDLTAALEQRVGEALAERRVLAEIVEGTDASVQVVDTGLRLIALNRAGEADFARNHGTAPRIGAPLPEAFRPEYRAALQALWQRALRGEVFTELFTFDIAGVSHHHEKKFAPLRDTAGRIIGAYQFADDVTERIHNEKLLGEAQAQLHEMQKMETIGQLTGGIAHDFNNLLTPIYGTLDVLQRRVGVDERSTRLIGAALQAAERARVLVGRLLAFARRAHLETQPVSISELVRGMAELIDRSLGPRFEVKLDLADGLPPAQVDPNQLELALLNLCVNARDATPGGGRLCIRADLARLATASGGLAAGDYLRLAVVDHGTGMDAETLRRAIEPFYTTKGVGQGTGLGLSMVHGLAAQSGGALRLESAPGRGTTATIWLPRATAGGQTATQAAPETAAPERPLFILLADDEELVRLGVGDMLEGLGHRVIGVGSAAAALEQLRAEPGIELLITDYMMPGMTGVALVREARKLRPGLPALLITGYSALDAPGADQLPRLSKPFRQADLLALLNTAMQSPPAPLRQVWPP